MRRDAWSWVVVCGCSILTGCPGSSSGSSGGAGAGSSDPAGWLGSAGTTSSPGAAGTTSSPGAAGTTSAAGAAGTAGQPSDDPRLPDGTLLYVRHETKDHDLLVARDLADGGERVVTDLTGDGSSGWEIAGYALSPDRRRIAIASLYGPTAADNATGLATRAIWTLSTDGTDFRRLTPTFPNGSQGRQSFSQEVGDPEWTADGTRVLFDFGTYWWEGGQLQGGSFPWSVSAQGGTPTTFPTSTDCGHVIHPSRNPATGEMLFILGLCIPGQGGGSGLYLYPPAGSKSPQKLIASAHVDGEVDVFYAKPAWFPDGSGFLFIGGVAETDWSPSLLAYDKKADKIYLVVPAPAAAAVYGVALSPDATKAVYCLRQDDDGAEDLHLLDLASASLTDTVLTKDGKSCDPSF